MSLTAAVFLLIYPAGLLLALFKHPRYGLYAYLFAFYMHPPDRWWRNEVPDLRWALIAGIVTLIATLFRAGEENRPAWFRSGAAQLLLAYLTWMALQSAWAVTGEFHAEGLELYAKYVVLFYLIYRLVDTEIEFRNFFIAHVLGCFYLGWLAYGRTVSGRLEGMGGPGIGDANTFGMHVATGAIFGAALMIRGGLYIRGLMLATLPFALNAMILTQSRGAFVGLVAGAIAAVVLRPPRIKVFFFTLGGLAVTLFLILSPPDFIERLKTILVATENVEEVDSSVNIRLALAEAQLKIFKANPFGTGHRGTRTLSGQFLDDEYLTKNRHGEGLARSSHNTYLTILVDQGLPGAIIYLCLMIWIANTAWFIKKLDAKELPRDLASYRMALGGALALVLASGMFSNYFKAEIAIWTIALLASLRELSISATDKAAIAAKETETLEQSEAPARPPKQAWQQQQYRQ